MTQTLTFAEIVEAADHLSIDEQETLLDILQRRLADEGRKRVIQDVRQSQEEFSKGLCRPSSADDFMKAILS